MSSSISISCINKIHEFRLIFSFSNFIFHLKYFIYYFIIFITIFKLLIKKIDESNYNTPLYYLKNIGNMRFLVGFFIISIIPLNKFSYTNVILLVRLKMIIMICYNKSQTSIHIILIKI